MTGLAEMLTIRVSMKSDTFIIQTMSSSRSSRITLRQILETNFRKRDKGGRVMGAWDLNAGDRTYRSR